MQTEVRTSSIHHSWWKRKVAKPTSNIDGSVRHVNTEQNEEADHWATIGAQRQRKLSMTDEITPRRGKR